MAALGPPGTDEADAAWRRLAERAIGRSLETLSSVTRDGLAVAPLHRRVPTDPQQPWRSTADWAVAQRVDHPVAADANRLALLDLEGGADALTLVGRESPYARGFGTALGAGDLDEALEHIELDFISLRLDAGPETADALTVLAALVEARRLTSAALSLDVGFDPIGWRARLGRAVADDPRPLLDARAKGGLAGTLYLADGRPWHEAGAGEAQELAAVLATAVAYLRTQEALGLDLYVARGNVAVLLAVDADIFVGLAKVRAMRRLWAQVETASGLAPRPLRLHAETSWRMMTRSDPWTNAMRATAATFAAGLGGADAITVLPFTLPRGLPDEVARRLARNTQRVLLDEAHLAKVADPSAGAGAFEALTDGLCRDAWHRFQEIEREGGIAASIESGALQTRVAATRAERLRDIAHLRHGIIGTSRFASLDVPDIDVLEVAPYPTVSAPDALPAARDAEPFEALRERADAIAADGPRLRVFLATLGAPAEFGPRASEAANYFAAAGLAVTTHLDALENDALVAAFAASGDRVACICGTDASYTAAAPTIAALRDAGARRVLRIGGGEARDAIDAVIADGCDALQILTDTLDAY